MLLMLDICRKYFSIFCKFKWKYGKTSPTDDRRALFYIYKEMMLNHE
jgi:hypothetical protein